MLVETHPDMSLKTEKGKNKKNTMIQLLDAGGNRRSSSSTTSW